jgi:hypothetical protein
VTSPTYSFVGRSRQPALPVSLDDLYFTFLELMDQVIGRSSTQGLAAGRNLPEPELRTSHHLVSLGASELGPGHFTLC